MDSLQLKRRSTRHISEISAIASEFGNSKSFFHLVVEVAKEILTVNPHQRIILAANKEEVSIDSIKCFAARGQLGIVLFLYETDGSYFIYFLLQM